MKVSFIKENYFAPYNKRLGNNGFAEIQQRTLKASRQALINSILEDEHLINVIKNDASEIFTSTQYIKNINVDLSYEDNMLAVIVSCYIRNHPRRRVFPTWRRICAKYNITGQEHILAFQGIKCRSVIYKIENAIADKTHYEIPVMAYFNMVTDEPINLITDLCIYSNLSDSDISYYYEFLNRLRGINLNNSVLMFYEETDERSNVESSDPPLEVQSMAEKILIKQPIGIFVKHLCL